MSEIPSAQLVFAMRARDHAVQALRRGESPQSVYKDLVFYYNRKGSFWARPGGTLTCTALLLVGAAVAVVGAGDIWAQIVGAVPLVVAGVLFTVRAGPAHAENRYHARRALEAAQRKVEDET